MKPATRSALIIFGLFMSGLGIASYWVYRGALDVKRQSEQRRALSSAESGDMVWIPAGGFTMGGIGEHALEHELPLHDVKISGFWMDRTEVTNEQFEAFVKATNYVTLAERPREGTEVPEVFKGVIGQPASLVRNAAGEWEVVVGANWRHPAGPGSDLSGKAKHPVVHIAREDALAYCAWAKKRLPTESEWEYAARGGMVAQPYVWGGTLKPDNDKWRANLRQGDGPAEDRAEDGYAGTSPAARFPANGYGLVDVAGNVWELTADLYRPDAYTFLHKNPDRQARRNPSGPTDSYDPDDKIDPRAPKYVIRGGSFLSSTSDPAQEFRPSAREKIGPQITRNDVGFRCANGGPMR